MFFESVLFEGLNSETEAMTPLSIITRNFSLSNTLITRKTTACAGQAAPST
jgi:hypothetical protein